jgi:hypothetical protein
MRSEFADYISKIYRKNVLWNESYFIASCGGVTVSVLRQYIENQGTPASHPDPRPADRGRGFPADELKFLLRNALR